MKHLDDNKMTPKELIYHKEKVYFWIVLVISIISYILFTVSIVGIPFILLLVLISFLLHGITIGQIRTNAVKLSAEQFPTIYHKVEELCLKMEMKKVPDVYVMQSGGTLNAFATRFFKKDMVIVYSEIFDLIEDGLDDELYFILAHELAHIKRNHLGKIAFILPSMWIPGVAETYLRACEYTCDRYAAYYSGNLGASKNSLMMLAIGKKLVHRTDKTEYMKQINLEKGFFVWLSEFVSTHPPLPKRIHAIQTYFGETEPIILSKKNNVIFGAIAFLLFGVFAGCIYFGFKAIDSFSPYDDFEDVVEEEVQDIPLMIQAAINGETKEIEKLAKAGNELDEEDYNGYTAMDWAIKAGNVEIVKTLLENGADPNNVSSYGMTPLMTAAEKGRPEIIKVLHAAGADVNYMDPDYTMTPLMYAAQGEDEETVKVLLELGADPEQKDYYNETPYMHAIDVGNENIAKLLKPNK
jgi:Zn-dependent protease with chaperone function